MLTAISFLRGKLVRMTTAKRVANFESIDEQQFCYYKAESRFGGPIDTWYLNIPGIGIANLHGHKVTEHEDGTITASPSILTTGYESGEKRTAHGYLERGVWRDC